MTAARSRCPIPGRVSAGLAKPLKSILHMNPIPILPRDRQRDHRQAHCRDRRRAGCRWASCRAPWRNTGRGSRKDSGRAGKRQGVLATFAIHASVHVEVDGDVKAAPRPAEAGGWRSMSAAWATRPRNFHNDIIGAPAASAMPPSASRNSTWVARRTRRSPRCPTTGST